MTGFYRGKILSYNYHFEETESIIMFIIIMNNILRICVFWGAVSKLDIFVWILNHVLRSLT